MERRRFLTSGIAAGAVVIVSALIAMAPLPSFGDDREAEVRTVIQAFYKAFDEGFNGPARSNVEGSARGASVIPEGDHRHDRDNGCPICKFRCRGRNGRERYEPLHVA